MTKVQRYGKGIQIYQRIQVQQRYTDITKIYRFANDTQVRQKYTCMT